MKSGIGIETDRISRVDDARSFVIFLVVMIHASVTYSGIGGWYVVENQPESLSVAELAAFGLFNSFSQAWFMGILFFFGGHFACEALARKGTARFLRDRLLRLGLPVAAYALVINPLMLYFVAFPEKSRAMGSFFDVYRSWYIGTGQAWSETGPLWFAEALLAFSVAFALVAAFRSRALGKSLCDGATRPAPSVDFLLGIALAIAACAFAIRIVMPIGTSWMNMQFCFFSSYVALFAIGVRSARGGWFETLTGPRSIRWLRAGLAVGIPAWAILMVSGGALSGDMESVMGRGTWQSAAYAVWESFVAIAMSLGVPALFARRKRRGGALSAFLSRNSFSVYVFHPVFLIGLTRLFADWAIYPIVKAPVIGFLAFSWTVVFAELVIRRVPGLRKYF